MFKYKYYTINTVNTINSYKESSKGHDECLSRKNPARAPVRNSADVVIGRKG